MMEKPRKRNHQDSSRNNFLQASDLSVTDKSEHRGSPSEGPSELEYLEVKHVALILLMVFILFFVGTLLFLNAINSKNDINIRNLSRDTPPINFPEKTENMAPDLGSKKEDDMRGKNSNKEVDIKKLKTLNLPTILWWTDLLYPHSLSGSPETKINCDVGTCFSTKEKAYLGAENTRGIMFYGTDFRAYEAPLPRQKWHEWALLHEESPMNNYVLSNAVMMRLFNHTGTFRRESHFPITTNSLPSLAFLTERQPVPLSTKNKLRRESLLAPIAYVQSHCDVASDRDSIHTWVQDYWSMHDQAAALDRMIREGYTDTTKLFDVLHEMYKERGRA